MESHTYGGSKAAEVLVDILDNKYPHLKRKVGAYWSDYSFTMNQLDRDCDLNHCVKENLCSLFYQDMMKTVGESGMPSEVISFLRNVMSKRWRELRKRI
jgi:hypothetical protein